MPISKLAHYSIRTTDLEKSCAFYERVLGFTQGYRPPFDFPGAWLYKGGDESDFGTVHIIGIDPDNPEGLAAYLGDKEPALTGTGGVDHIAFLATGVAAMWETLKAEGIAWRDRTVPSLGLHQVFIEDPSGVTIELNYPASEVAHLNVPQASAAQGSKGWRLIMTTLFVRPKAIIVGGSMGGLFAANLLMRNGWEVDVFERVPDEFAGRGAGIVTHPELFDALTAAGVAFDDTIGVKVQSRVTFAQDGAVLSARELPQTLTAWGKMYHVLRSAFPDSLYHPGGSVVAVEERRRPCDYHAQRWTVRRADLVIAADGFKSAVRELLSRTWPAVRGIRGMAWSRRRNVAFFRHTRRPFRQICVLLAAARADPGLSGSGSRQQHDTGRAPL